MSLVSAPRVGQPHLVVYMNSTFESFMQKSPITIHYPPLATSVCRLLVPDVLKFVDNIDLQIKLSDYSYANREKTRRTLTCFR